MTVSNVVNGRPGPSAPTRRRVEEAIRELGYVRDAGAHALRVGRAPALGFLMEDESRRALHDPVHAALLTGMVERARHRGLTVAVLVASPATIDEQVDLVVRERRVGGLLLSLQGTPDRHAALLERLGAEGVPTVVFEQTASVRGVHSIGSDNEGGGRAVAAHLTDLGHRRIAVLTGGVPWPGGERRLAGFREVARDAGAELLEWRTPQWNAAAARDVARARLVAERPTALFAANDVLAVGVLHAAEDAGLRVPDDLSVAGFDDLELAALLRPALTTVRVEVAEMGEWAASALIATLDGDATPQHAVLPAALVVRESTTRPAARAARRR
jgi:LacI family transcriptional regulator